MVKRAGRVAGLNPAGVGNGMRFDSICHPPNMEGELGRAERCLENSWSPYGDVVRLSPPSANFGE